MHAMHHPYADPFAARRSRGRGRSFDDDDHGHGPGPRWLAMAARRGGPRPRPGDHEHGPGHGHGRGHGGPFGGPGGGPRGRARRGDIRAAVLRLLAEQPMHGYQIIQELSARTGGVWQPSPGSIYPTLQALEDQGLVRAGDVEGKRVFTLTDDGQAEVARSREQQETTPWDEVAAGTGGMGELREVAMGVLGAARQVGRAGTPSQITRAVAVLKDARRKLYQLLAEDNDDEPTS